MHHSGQREAGRHQIQAGELVRITSRDSGRARQTAALDECITPALTKQGAPRLRTLLRLLGPKVSSKVTSCEPASLPACMNTREGPGSGALSALTCAPLPVRAADRAQACYRCSVLQMLSRDERRHSLCALLHRCVLVLSHKDLTEMHFADMSLA